MRICTKKASLFGLSIEEKEETPIGRGEYGFSEARFIIYKDTFGFPVRSPPLYRKMTFIGWNLNQSPQFMKTKFIMGILRKLKLKLLSKLSQSTKKNILVTLRKCNKELRDKLSRLYHSQSFILKHLNNHLP